MNVGKERAIFYLGGEWGGWGFLCAPKEKHDTDVVIVTHYNNTKTTEFHIVPRQNAEFHLVPRQNAEFHLVPRQNAEFHLACVMRLSSNLCKYLL